MEKPEIRLGTIVSMKKAHPCGSNEWEITRLGVDLKLKCLNCERVVVISRLDFYKKMKKIVKY